MKGIYAIRNKINGKVYIGQSRNIPKRFKQHLDALLKGVHHSKKLQKDFDEFGPDKFALEVLELCTSEELDQKEMEWITKFDALRNGYNTQDPRTRKSWFGFIKRQKRPAVTVKGEFSRILRDFFLEMAEDFRSWLTINKEKVQRVIACLVVAGLIVAVIAIGFLLLFLGFFPFLLYVIFIVLSVFMMVEEFR